MGRIYCMAHRKPKVAYESEEVALIAIEDCNSDGHRRPRGKGGRRPTRAYACGSHWHITAWPDASTPKR